MTEEPESVETAVEAERIRRVYRTYDTPARTRLYDGANPGNRAIVEERVRRMRRLLAEAGLADLGGRRVLDVGCGHGHELARMRELGARGGDLLGVDLMPERIERARELHPDIEFRVGDATRLELPSESFDLVLSFTVLSSVLATDAARRIAAEMRRMLRPGGAILWYDLRRDNPRNANVRGLPAPEVRALFPGLRARLERVTLAPPLARRLGPLTGPGYPALAAVPFLRSHLVGVLARRD
ncbi:MAG TPA: class I SAM-dependent methyltransferase [Candidatus Dormibacteraeota bacterium]